jgi:hypothetical protein
MAQFLSPLQLEYVDGRFWKVLGPFDYAIGAYDADKYVDIPIGFLTDFASIPKIFWNIYPPTGSYGKAAVIHDKLYQAPFVKQHSDDQLFSLTRKECDRIFLEAMAVLGVGWFSCTILYLGVRFGGFVTWNKYRRTRG